MNGIKYAAISSTHLLHEMEIRLSQSRPYLIFRRFSRYFLLRDILAIELVDSAENFFDSQVFSDENDIKYKDDDYKNKHKAHYLSEIRNDFKWYGFVYRNIKHHFNISGRTITDVVTHLITEYHLIKSEV